MVAHVRCPLRCTSVYSLEVVQSTVSLAQQDPSSCAHCTASPSPWQPQELVTHHQTAGIPQPAAAVVYRAGGVGQEGWGSCQQPIGADGPLWHPSPGRHLPT